MSGYGLKSAMSAQGYTYAEVLAVTLLIAVSLVPALDALHTSIVSEGLHESLSIEQHRALSKMEEVLAEPYAQLDGEATMVANPAVPTSYSDASGSATRALVFLSRYDGDNADGDDDPFTGTDPDLLWIRVQIEDSVYALETLADR